MQDSNVNNKWQDENCQEALQVKQGIGDGEVQGPFQATWSLNISIPNLDWTKNRPILDAMHPHQDLRYGKYKIISS